MTAVSGTARVLLMALSAVPAGSRADSTGLARSLALGQKEARSALLTLRGLGLADSAVSGTSEQWQLTHAGRSAAEALASAVHAVASVLSSSGVPMTVREISEASGCTQADARTALKALRESGQAAPSGSVRSQDTAWAWITR